jgi:DNA-binding transcriptional MerR regulator
MNGIRTNAAAAMLGISPNTLRSWERRYGFPQPSRSAGNQRQFAITEIEALKQTMGETHNVSSAISLARARGEGPSSASRLTSAFAAFDEDRADRLLEESLALRSVERTVEEVLLPAVAAHRVEPERYPPEYEFAWRHATGWLSALKRLTPPSSRDQAVLIFDATLRGDLDAIHVHALELILRRSGLRALVLTPAVDPARLGRALRALAPSAVVLTGRHSSLDAIGKLVHAVLSVAPQAIVCDYRNAVPDTATSTVYRLGDGAIAARDRLLDRLDAPAPLAATGAQQRSRAARSA